MPVVLNIGIVGYGRMGKEIERIAKERHHTIPFTVDPSAPDASATTLSALKDTLSTANIIIDFSLPDAILENTKLYTQHNISAIVGTTGWESQKDKIQSMVESSESAFVYGGNFSIGAHMFIRISTYAAKLINNIPDYDIALFESHHNKKQDRPSGTALLTAEKVLKEIDRKTHIITDLPAHSTIDPQSIPLVSQRIGHEVGYHECVFDSPADTICISHHARSRAGFALGAVMAAEWTIAQNKKGFIHVDDCFLALQGNRI